MEVSTINGFSEFDAIVQGIDRSDICRGVSDEKYELVPSLFRGKQQPQIEKMESDLMWLFKTQAIPYLESTPKTDIEWLVLAQHHGLPTRLLDWSLSPLVALYFAVQSQSSSDGAIYIYSGRTFAQEERLDLKSLVEPVAFIPSHLSPRVTAQSGMFTVHPLGGAPIDTTHLQKIIIPSQSKKILAERLTKYGIHHGTMVPGLDGISKYIRYLHRY